MNLKNLFFHIHYCNRRYPNDPRKPWTRITRTLQHHELILVTGGTGRITVDNRSHVVQEGILYYIRPHVLHKFENDARDPICCFTVHFSCADIRFDDGAWSVGNEANPLPLQEAQSLKNGYQIADTFKKLVESWYAKQPGYELIAKAYLQHLLFEIFQLLLKQNENHAVSLKIEKVIEYMHQHIGQRVLWRSWRKWSICPRITCPGRSRERRDTLSSNISTKSRWTRPRNCLQRETKK